MGKVTLMALLCLCLCLQTGCSVYSVQFVEVDKINADSNAEIRLPSTNNELYAQNGNYESQGQVDKGKLCRVKYHRSYFKNKWMVVEGQLGGGKTYPVVLDTGASPGLLVNDIHVRENKLAIRSLNEGQGAATGWGVCNIGELQIGPLSLVKWPSYYRNQIAEVKVFGLPIARNKAIIAGLPTLREFKYVAFDSIKKR